MTKTGQVHLQALGQEILDRAKRTLEEQTAQDQQAAAKAEQEAAQARMDRAVSIFCQVTGADPAEASQFLPEAISEKQELILPLAGYQLVYTDSDKEDGVLLRGQNRAAEKPHPGIYAVEERRVTSPLDLARAVDDMDTLPSTFTLYSNGAGLLAVTSEGAYIKAQDSRYRQYKLKE